MKTCILIHDIEMIFFYKCVKWCHFLKLIILQTLNLSINYAVNLIMKTFIFHCAMPSVTQIRKYAYCCHKQSSGHTFPHMNF